jgi:hypothetical protein
MARLTINQSSFAFGEISPLSYGRVNVAAYRQGLKTCRNAVVGARGELHRRPGTRFVAATKANSQAVLIPFRYTADKAYVIELGPGNMRFFTQRAPLKVGGVIYELVTPYSVDELADVRFAQDADVLFLVHPNHPPQRLQRLSDSAFSLEDFPFTVPVWDTQNTDPDIKLVVNSGAITATSGTPFDASWVGRSVRFFDTDWKQGKVTSVISATQAQLDQSITVTETSQWQLSAFYSGNYPSQVLFHEERLVFAATASRPQTFWMSQIADYQNFAPTEEDGTVVDTNAISGTMNDNQINKIHWLASLNANLLVGTESGVWVVRSSNSSTGLSPSSVIARRQHATASAAVPPILIGDSLMFLNRPQRKLYSLRLDNGVDHYSALDESLLADHILGSGGSRMAYQESPHGLLWIARRDGQMACLSYDVSREVIGWSRHDLGGDAAKVESLAAIPQPNTGVQGADTSPDDLWLVVSRQVGGQTQRFIEHFESYWSYESTLEQAFFVDAGLSFSGQGMTSFTGLDHLNGQSLVALVDGQAISGLVPSGGALTPPQSADQVQIGLPYATEGEILDIDAGGDDGSAIGKPRAIFEVTFNVWRSWQLRAGPSLDTLRPLAFQSAAEDEDPNLPLPRAYSGLVRQKQDEGGWKRRTNLAWQQSDPYPFTLLSLTLRLSSAGG